MGCANDPNTRGNQPNERAGHDANGGRMQVGLRFVNYQDVTRSDKVLDPEGERCHIGDAGRGAFHRDRLSRALITEQGCIPLVLHHRNRTLEKLGQCLHRPVRVPNSGRGTLTDRPTRPAEALVGEQLAGEPEEVMGGSSDCRFGQASQAVALLHPSLLQPNYIGPSRHQT